MKTYCELFICHCLALVVDGFGTCNDARLVGDSSFDPPANCAGALQWNNDNKMAFLLKIFFDDDNENKLVSDGGCKTLDYDNNALGSVGGDCNDSCSNDTHHLLLAMLACDFWQCLLVMVATAMTMAPVTSPIDKLGMIPMMMIIES